MRKVLSIIACALFVVVQGCSKFDDDPLWNAVNGIEESRKIEAATSTINTNLLSLNKIVNSIQNNNTVVSVSQIDNGIQVGFSDGIYSTILNTVPEIETPVVSVKSEDETYYWVLGGNSKTAVSSVAPKLRVNSSSKEWEISADNGSSWKGTGVMAKAGTGNSVFKNTDNTSDPEFVIFTLQDNSELKVAKYNDLMPLFEVEESDGLQVIHAGTEKSYKVNARNIAKYMIQKPYGWKVTYDGENLTITAPAEENASAEETGTVSVYATSESGKSMIVNIEVATYELRYLTFEDADTKFTAYTLDYCSKEITKWSDLIDNPQYGGPMLYGGYGACPYYWYDEKNTEIYSELNGGGPFWMGGEVISNYYDADFKDKSYPQQLTVSVVGGAEGKGGHNGSANFAVHNGYSDSDREGRVGFIYFGDGVSRVIDHMYVTNMAYGLNSLAYGDAFNSAATPTTWVKLCAIGYNENEERIGVAEFYLCKDGVAVNEWSRFDLSSLGKVFKVEFNFLASEDQGGSYGVNFPAYFAYDDIAVRF